MIDNIYMNNSKNIDKLSSAKGTAAAASNKGKSAFPNGTFICSDGPIRVVPAPKTWKDYPLVLRAKDVSEILHLSKDSVYNLLHRSDFPAKWITPHKVIVYKTVLREWLESNETNAIPKS